MHGLNAHFETSQLVNAQFEISQGATTSSKWVLHTFSKQSSQSGHKEAEAPGISNHFWK